MRRSLDLLQGWTGAAVAVLASGTDYSRALWEVRRLLPATGAMAGLIAWSYGYGGWLQALPALVLSAALAALYQRYSQLRQTHLEALARISSYAARSGKNTLHAATAGDLCRRVARQLRLRPVQVDEAYLAGVLHDIGELKLDERLLHKVYHRVMLTDSEVHAYRQHAVLGEELVAPIPGMAPVAAAIRHHHEKWDGSGYPDGLQAENIPITARIVAAVESYLQTTEAELHLDLDRKVAIANSQSGTLTEPAVAAALARAVREPSATRPVLPQIQPASGIYAELQQAVRDSRLLETMGIGRIYRWRAGRFTDGAAQPASPPMSRTVARLAARTLAERRVLREHLVQEHPEQVYDVYCFPASEDVANVVMFDVTAVLAVEREELRRLQKAYSDVIAAVTRGRMRLVLPADLPPLLVAGDTAGAVGLTEVSTSRAARQLVGEVLSGAGFATAQVFRAQVAVAEAVGNVFKHAGRGRLEVRQLPTAVRIIVTDQGPGIPLDTLPQAFLVDGFSTKVSLGKGYTLMLQYMDRLLVATSSDGTTLILEKQLPPEGETRA